MQVRRGAPSPKPRLIRADQPQITSESLRTLRHSATRTPPHGRRSSSIPTIAGHGAVCGSARCMSGNVSYTIRPGRSVSDSCSSRIGRSRHGSRWPRPGCRCGGTPDRRTGHRRMQGACLRIPVSSDPGAYRSDRPITGPAARVTVLPTPGDRRTSRGAGFRSLAPPRPRFGARPARCGRRHGREPSRQECLSPDRTAALGRIAHMLYGAAARSGASRP